MSTWIKWPPEARENIFPKDFQIGDPLDLYCREIQSESCSKCGFTVEWVISMDDFDDWNEDTRRHIRDIFVRQQGLGLCPSHPKPNGW